MTAQPLVPQEEGVLFKSIEKGNPTWVTILAPQRHVLLVERFPAIK